tara:strand:- start:73 stop:525 length:453 start_codon:yes stop_codon:yes gene_type:complete
MMKTTTNKMSSYNYTHTDQTVVVIELYLRMHPNDIEGIEEYFYTAVSGYTTGGDDYSLVVKTDGSEVGTTASFSHNHKTEEKQIYYTLCEDCDPQEGVQYKAIISLPSLVEEIEEQIQEDGFTDNRARGLKVNVLFTERGWSTLVWNDYD